MAVLEGEAGVGKTRLIQELLRSDPFQTHRQLVGACDPLGEILALGPVVEALRPLAESDSLGNELPPITGALRPYLPELAPMLPPVPAPQGDAKVERHRVFRSITELLGALPRTLVVLEDLHWADDLTTAFIAYAINHLPPSASLVATYRAEDALKHSLRQ